MLWKVIQNKISGWKNPENLFSIRNIHYAWLLKAKNRLFNPGQNFCPGQFKYCPGQKIFCPGRWTRQLSIVYSQKSRAASIWLFIMMFFICLVHLPRQNIFCPGQYSNSPGQKFCPGLKSPFFGFQSYSKWAFVDENDFLTLFLSGNFILNNCWK